MNSTSSPASEGRLGATAPRTPATLFPNVERSLAEEYQLVSMLVVVQGEKSIRDDPLPPLGEIWLRLGNLVPHELAHFLLS